jgi:hypothetical protein
MSDTRKHLIHIHFYLTRFRAVANQRQKMVFQGWIVALYKRLHAKTAISC